MADHKIIVLGSGGVGKSALTIQFVQSKFVEKYDPTIEDCYKKSVNIGGEKREIEILDTAGTEQFTALKDVYMKTGDAFAVVYSITSMATFNDIQQLIEQIHLIRDSTDVPIIIVGNKSDLDDERQVSDDLGRQLAERYNCKFIEASAKLRLNVDEIFLGLVRQLNKPTPKPNIIVQPTPINKEINIKPDNNIPTPTLQPEHKKKSFWDKVSDHCNEACSIL